MWTVSWIYTHCCVQKAPRCSFRVNGSLWNNWAWKRGKTSSIGDCRVYPTEMVLDVRQQCWNLETDLPYGGGLSQDFPALVDLLIWNSILCSKWVTVKQEKEFPFGMEQGSLWGSLKEQKNRTINCENCTGYLLFLTRSINAIDRSATWIKTFWNTIHKDFYLCSTAAFSVQEEVSARVGDWGYLSCVPLLWRMGSWKLLPDKIM